MSNLFLVRDQVLLTPDLSCCGVAGIMRSIILECAEQLSLTAEIRALDIADLKAADEVFICNSLIGIWPVIAIDGRPYPKGAITSQIQQRMQAAEDNGSAWRP
jgi:4-amino-4-deoxychorismate lyase